MSLTFRCRLANGITDCVPIKAGSFCPRGQNFVFIDGHAPPRDPSDHVEAELACAQGGHHEPPSLIGRVGLVVAPAAACDQLFQVEVGATGDRLITW